MNLEESRKVLGVDASADEKAVRRAYAKLAKSHRPDTHPETFLSIRTAYDTVLDSIKNTTYQDPSLPPTPSHASGSTAPPPAIGLAGENVVSYVMGADEFGHIDVDEPIEHRVGNPSVGPADGRNDEPIVESIAEPRHLPPSEGNPLQHLEDDLIDAIKATKPGVEATESKVLGLMETYLTAAGASSRQLRDYVERFLIGACLGDYYVPHAMRIRVLDLCGLHDAVMAEDRLKPWEKELITRFDESEWLTGLLERAALKQNVAEHALVHGASWTKTLSLRMGLSESKTVRRWLHWLDHTYGADAGIANEHFRHRWQKLRQVGPVTGPVMLVFTVFMMVTGWGLDALGVPLRPFFELPPLHMVQLSASLAVLSWANFILVLSARPVLDRLISVVRDGLFEHAPVPLLLLEVIAISVLIWVWSYHAFLPNAISGQLMMNAGVVMLLIGVFARVWDNLNDMPFSTFGMRLVWQLSIFIFLVFFQGSQSGDESLSVLGRWSSSDLISSAWLLVGLTVLAVPPRILHRWHEIEPGNKRVSLTHLRHTNLSFNTVWLRLIIGIGAALCLAGVGAEYLHQESAWIGPLITGSLLSLLALELSLAGGLNDESNTPLRILAYSACFVFYWLTTRLVQDALYLSMLAHTAMAVTLLWLVVACHSPKSAT